MSFGPLGTLPSKDLPAQCQYQCQFTCSIETLEKVLLNVSWTSFVQYIDLWPTYLVNCVDNNAPYVEKPITVKTMKTPEDLSKI